MESALIVSCADKATAFFMELLNAASINQIAALRVCAEARRLLLERCFDLVIVDAPLRDETGENFSRHIAAKGISQVILVVKNEHFDAVSANCEGDGVLVVAKPVNRIFFWSALSLTKSAWNRQKQILEGDEKLKQKIEDIRIIDRAKWLLMSRINLSEQEAHRFIEKQAMDRRFTKRTIAEKILKTYEN